MAEPIPASVSLMAASRADYSASSSAGGGGGKKAGVGKQHNTLPFWGNETSMNLNPLILANIQSSSYFKGAFYP